MMRSRRLSGGLVDAFMENQTGLYVGKQWAAVRTKLGEIRTPPQTWDPLKCSVTCHGHWPSLAKLPPMIRDVERCCPQSNTGGGREMVQHQ